MPATPATDHAQMAGRTRPPGLALPISTASSFSVIPDAATAAAALQSGAVDWVEQPLIDLLPVLRRSRDIAVEVKELHRDGRPPQAEPFTSTLRQDQRCAACCCKRSVRRIACSPLLAMRRRCGATVSASSPPARRWQPRRGLPPSGTRPDLPSLRRALAEADAGDRVVMLAAADVPRISAVCEVTAEVMRRLGMNIDTSRSGSAR